MKTHWVEIWTQVQEMALRNQFLSQQYPISNMEILGNFTQKESFGESWHSSFLCNNSKNTKKHHKKLVNWSGYVNESLF